MARESTAARLRGHVEMLAGTIGERNMWRYDELARAAAYLSDTLQSYGYAPGRQAYEVQGRHVENIEGVLAGAAERERIVVIGAHYDSVVGCPGANDNASGVAAMLELARRLAGAARRNTIRFVAFVNEEPPYFQTPTMGSMVYANDAKRRGDQVSAMLSLETIGYYSEAPHSQRYPLPLTRVLPSRGNFITFVSNLRSARLLGQAARAFRARSRFPLLALPAPERIPGVGWSDHSSFWRAGYPAIMVTDTAPYRYPWYHTAHDTPARVSIGHLAEVVDGLEHVVHVLAGGR